MGPDINTQMLNNEEEQNNNEQKDNSVQNKMYYLDSFLDGVDYTEK